jgi:hypothetical protein
LAVAVLSPLDEFEDLSIAHRASRRDPVKGVRDHEVIRICRKTGNSDVRRNDRRRPRNREIDRDLEWPVDFNAVLFQALNAVAWTCALRAICSDVSGILRAAERRMQAIHLR